MLCLRDQQSFKCQHTTKTKILESVKIDNISLDKSDIERKKKN